MWDENKVRIIDIAEELGVSTATVSNVLHGKTKKISDETVKLVEKKLEERGYIPNMAATLLARNNSRIIGVIVNNHKKYEGRVFEDSFIAATLNFLLDEIEKSGYFMMIKKSRDIMDIVSFSTMWNLSCMILIGFCEDDYQNLRDHIRIPFVVYDGFMRQRERICNVTIDDFLGGRLAGEYLKKMGHKKVLCVSDNEICMDAERYKGLCEGLERTADFLAVPMTRRERLCFYEDKLDFIKTHTAVFAVSDEYAVELMNFLLEKRIRIPDDISVVGFDGSSLSQKVFPPLTTIKQDTAERANKVVELLCHMISEPDFSESICLPVELLEGASVKNVTLLT